MPDNLAEVSSQKFSFRRLINKVVTMGKENTANLSARQLDDLSNKYADRAYQTVGWAGLSTWAAVVGAGVTVLTRDPMIFAATVTLGGSALAEGALAEKRQEMSERFTKLAQKLRPQNPPNAQ
jgi:hypothetical protein